MLILATGNHGYGHSVIRGICKFSCPGLGFSRLCQGTGRKGVLVVKSSQELSGHVIYYPNQDFFQNKKGTNTNYARLTGVNWGCPGLMG